MEGFITTPIEQAVSSAEGIDYITSASTQGQSKISVFVKLNFDPNQALTEVLSKVNSVKYLIPREANDPIILKTTGQTTAVMYLGFSSDELSGSAISDYLARVVQPILSTVDGVASADILGGQTFAMRIWLDPARMAGRGVSPDDIAAAIRASNFQAAAGQAKGYFIVSNVTANTDLQNVDQFKRMTVKAKDGGFVRLEDVATVELSAQSTDASVAFQRRAGDLHRCAGDAPGQSAEHRYRRARAISRTRAQPSAIAQDEGGLRFYQVHPLLD